jgi:hypothetical protein
VIAGKLAAERPTVVRSEQMDADMPRQRQRFSLQDCLRLDITWLVRRGLISPGSVTGPHSVRWVNSDGEVIASGWINADMEGDTEGLFCIRIGDFEQRIRLVTLPRHYGGRQWFFVCPLTDRRASILWLPLGAQQFASRHAWPDKVAYRSQFMTPTDRVHLAKEKIKKRLIGELDPEEWDLPPKPKWMRWRTYHRLVEKFERYEATIDRTALSRVTKLVRRR